MISLHLQRMAAFPSAAQLTILASELLHLRAFAQEHFRYGLAAFAVDGVKVRYWRLASIQKYCNRLEDRTDSLIT